MHMYSVHVFSGNMRAPLSHQFSLAKHKFKDKIIRNLKKATTEH